MTREEREQVIEYIKKYRELDKKLYQTAPFTTVSKNALTKCLRYWDITIKALERELKTGHWNIVSDGYGNNACICECSNCGDTVWVYKDLDRKWNYCPNCGARMKGDK